MTARFATSLPGFIPSGTVLTSPSSLFAQRASILGLSATSSGVLPPSASQGRSAMPSPSITIYFRFSIFIAPSRATQRALFLFILISFFSLVKRAPVASYAGVSLSMPRTGPYRKLFVPYAGVLKPELSERAKCAIFVGANAIRGQKNIPNRFGIFFVRR